MKAKKDNSLFAYYGFTKGDAKKYPVISGILKQLTPERIKKEIEEIQKVKLPSELQKWVKEYEKMGDRDEYVWKWLHRIANIAILPLVDKSYRKSLANTKFLIFFFTGLLDDIADKYKFRNKKLLKELLKIPFDYDSIRFNELNSIEKKYIQFTYKVFKYIKNTIKTYPRYKEFEDLFEFDIIQLLNSIRYSYLVNESLNLINRIEYWMYLSHNMTVFVNLTIDLTCLPVFNIRNLRALRESGWEVQKMARIANWLSTWEREIQEGDFTSGVFAYAFDSGLLNSNILKKKSKLKVIEKIKNSQVEKDLLRDWEESYRKLDRMRAETKSVNMKKIINNFKELSENLLFYHISSKFTYKL